MFLFVNINHRLLVFGDQTNHEVLRFSPNTTWENIPVEQIFEKQQEQGKYNHHGTFGGKTYNYIEPINYVKKDFVLRIGFSCFGNEQL